MKKLLSIFAAAAVVFGFASCSGDLHDVSSVDLSTLQVKGSIFTWDSGKSEYKFTADTDGTYYYEFIATADSAAFAIDDTGADGSQAWATTYRGTSTDELNKDFEEAASETTSTLYPHDDGDCMPLGLEPGATYRIILKSGPGNIECTVKKVAEAIPFLLITDEGKALSCSATGATSFVYDFNEKTAGTLQFFVKSGTAYYAPASNSELTTTVGESDVDGTSTPATTYWTFDYEKEVPYRVSIEYDEDTGAIDVSVGYQFLISDNILSGSQFNDNVLTWEFTSEYATAKFEFTYDTSKTGWGSPDPWAIHVDGWGHKYCGATVELGKGYIDLIAGSNDNAVFSGLTNGTTYILTIKATTEKVSAKVEAK